jgi:hypothetical protein
MKFSRLFIFCAALLSLSTPARADCADPAGKAGLMDYFTAENTYKFCDGTDWIDIGGGAVTATADQGATCTPVGAFAIMTGNTAMLACLDGGGGTLVWTNLTGGGSTYTGPLVNGVHTGTDCTNDLGVVADADAGNKLCKFSGASCPAGWTQYQNWSGTNAVGCSAPLCGGGCNTGGHTWANLPVETCGYWSGEICEWTGCTATKVFSGCY